MLSKNTIKFIRSLSINKFRYENKAFVVEGFKSIYELIHSNLTIETLYLTVEANEIFRTTRSGVKTEIITGTAMKQISQMPTPPGILAIVAMPDTNIDPSALRGQLSLVLDGISDPGNLGTIIRTADWFGIRNIICSEDTVDPFHPKVVQSTMGSLFRVQITNTPLDTFLSKSSSLGLAIYGALLDGQSIYQENLQTSSSLIVIGSESHGIRPAVLPFIERPLTIPLPTNKTASANPESLNASIAASIIMAEFRRQG